MTSPNGQLSSRIARFAALAAIAGLVLAACGGGTESTSVDDPIASPASPASPESASSASTATTVPDAPAAGTGTEAAVPVVAWEIPAALLGVTTIDGALFDADTLAGRPTVAWFWAPWCVICRAEAPDVADVVARYGDRVNFVGVAGRGEAPEMREFVVDTDTGSFPHLDDSSGDIWASYEIYAQPAFAFITADGRLETFTGSLGGDELAAIVDQLLVA